MKISMHGHGTGRRSSRTVTSVIMALLLVLLTGCGSGQPEKISQDTSVNETAASGESDAAPGDTSAAATESVPVDPSVTLPTESVPADQSAAADTMPKRVVAVSKSIAELWLLAGGTLVGTTEDAMELDGITEETAGIGTLSEPSLEAILALSPDLVFLTEEIPAQAELKTELDGMGIRTWPIVINSFEDYMTVMQQLTDITGRPDMFDQNAWQVKVKIDAIKDVSKDIAAANAAAHKTFLAMRISATKNKVFKDDYFACEIFRDFGLTNIAEGNTNLDELNLEAIVAANPDFIFVIPQGRESDAMESYKAQFQSNPVWNELNAVKESRVFIMPKDYFQYKPNAKWNLAYEYIRGLFQKT